MNLLAAIVCSDLSAWSEILFHGLLLIRQCKNIQHPTSMINFQRLVYASDFRMNIECPYFVKFK